MLITADWYFDLQNL